MFLIMYQSFVKSDEQVSSPNQDVKIRHFAPFLRTRLLRVLEKL